MQKRDKFSVCALLFVLTGEVFAILAMRSEFILLWVGAAIVLLAIIATLCVGNIYNLEFRPKSIVASNLLANAISPRTISAFYLLFFVIHIGWITDGSFNLFLPNAYTDSREVIVSLLTGVIGTTFLIIFFPKSGGKKDETVTTVFVSGISTPIVPQSNSYEKLNLRPFVRLLQVIHDDNFELLILKTNQLNKDEKTVQNLLSVLEFIRNNTASEKNISNIDEVRKLFESQKELSDDEINRMVKILIIAVAQKEFVDKGWLKIPIEVELQQKWGGDVLNWLKNIEDRIKFTDSCNYNDFNECYSVLNNEISEIDEKKNFLVFNLSPGTSVVGGLMTLMAIDPKRDLYYYSQDEIEDDKRMVKIDKDYESLKKQFSAVLEKIQAEER